MSVELQTFNEQETYTNDSVYSIRMKDFLKQFKKDNFEPNHPMSVVPLQRPRCSVSPINNCIENESFISHDESIQQPSSFFPPQFFNLNQIDNQSPPQISRVVSFNCNQTTQLQSNTSVISSSPFPTHLQPLQMSLFSPNIHLFAKRVPIQSTPNKYFTPSKTNAQYNSKNKVNFHSINDLAKSSTSDSMHEYSLTQIPAKSQQQSTFQSFANPNESFVNQTRDSGFCSNNVTDSSMVEKLKAISISLQNKENCHFIEFVSTTNLLIF